MKVWRSFLLLFAVGMIISLCACTKTETAMKPALPVEEALEAPVAEAVEDEPAEAAEAVRRLGFVFCGMDDVPSEDMLNDACLQAGISSINDYDEWLCYVCSDVEQAVMQVKYCTEADCTILLLVDCPDEYMSAIFENTQLHDIAVYTASGIVDPEAAAAAAEEAPAALYTLNSLRSGFSEGIAWASVADESGENYIAAINQKAEIIYLVSSNDPVETTQFSNGLSAVFKIKRDASVHSHAECGFTIIDSTGKEVYTSEDLYMCGALTNGRFLVAKHNSSFDEDAWYSYILDNKMNLSDGVRTGSMEDCYNLKEFCDRVFFIEIPSYSSDYYGYVINFDLGYSQTFSFDTFRSGYIMDYGMWDQYIIPTSKLCEFTADELCNWHDNIETIKLGHFKIGNTTTSGTLFKWHDEPALLYHVNNDYIVCDLNQNQIFKYPELSYEKVTSFSNNYSVVLVKGADREYYVTAIGEDGNMAYEPVKVGYVSIYNIGGYAVTSKGIIDLKGNYVNPGDDLSELDSKDKRYSVEDILYISDGYIYYEKRDDYVTESKILVSLDGKNVIDELTATEDVVNYSKFVEDAADSSQISEPTSDNNLSKTYITKNNFSIDGKWKNIGTYTFGQVQSGTIVVFDGTNCNVYSPSDTYAFYKDGDYYKLDCTSMLFSETLSFTVKIVDDDHIDIYNGDYYLEMQRVG